MPIEKNSDLNCYCSKKNPPNTFLKRQRRKGSPLIQEKLLWAGKARIYSPVAARSFCSTTVRKSSSSQKISGMSVSGISPQASNSLVSTRRDVGFNLPLRPVAALFSRPPRAENPFIPIRWSLNTKDSRVISPPNQ